MNAETVRLCIVVTVFGLFFLCVVLLCVGTIPPANKELAMLLVGNIAALAGTIVGYYFVSQPKD